MLDSRDVVKWRFIIYSPIRDYCSLEFIRFSGRFTNRDFPIIALSTLNIPVMSSILKGYLTGIEDSLLENLPRLRDFHDIILCILRFLFVRTLSL